MIIERLGRSALGLAINVALFIWGWQRWKSDHKKSGAFILVLSAIGLIAAGAYILGFWKIDETMPQIEESTKQGIRTNTTT